MYQPGREAGRIVVLTSDVEFDTKCQDRWMVEEQALPPLEALARAGIDPDPNDLGQCEYNETIRWVYTCSYHKTVFEMNERCPQLYEQHKAGEQMQLPVSSAERLVEAGFATYPTHVADEQPDEYLSKINALMEQEGLPLWDKEGVKSLRIQGKKGSSHYRPRDNHLANDLGIDPADIADMRNLSKGR